MIKISTKKLAIKPCRVSVKIWLVSEKTVNFPITTFSAILLITHNYHVRPLICVGILCISPLKIGLII